MLETQTTHRKLKKKNQLEVFENALRLILNTNVVITFTKYFVFILLCNQFRKVQVNNVS